MRLNNNKNISTNGNGPIRPVSYCLDIPSSTLTYPEVRWIPDTTVQPPRVRKLYCPTGHEPADLHLSAPLERLGSGDPLFVSLTKWLIAPLVYPCSGDLKRLGVLCLCLSSCRETVILDLLRHILPSSSISSL
jgi:hypothetical protein